MCRSDAPLSTAMVRRSLTCMDSGCWLTADDRSAEARLFRIHVSEPPVRVGNLAVDDVEEGALQRLGDRTAAAAADLNLVDRADRRDFGGGADNEHFVRDVERLAGDIHLGDREAEVAGERRNGVASDAAEDRRRDRG